MNAFLESLCYILEKDEFREISKDILKLAEFEANYKEMDINEIHSVFVLSKEKIKKVKLLNSFS